MNKNWVVNRKKWILGFVFFFRPKKCVTFVGGECLEGCFFQVPKGVWLLLGGRTLFRSWTISTGQIAIPASSKCVKCVPFRPKNQPKGWNFIYLEDPGIKKQMAFLRPYFLRPYFLDVSTGVPSIKANL